MAARARHVRLGKGPAGGLTANPLVDDPNALVGTGSIDDFVTAEDLVGWVGVEPGSEDEVDNRSLFLFSTRNPVRVICTAVSGHMITESAVLVLVALNSAMLAIDSPAFPPEKAMAQVLHVGEVAITGARSMMFPHTALLERTLAQIDTPFATAVIFSAELMIKFVASGLILHKGAHLRSIAGWLDFSTVCGGWLDILSSGSSPLGNALRAMRVFRLLRVVRYVGDVRIFTEAVAGSAGLFRDVIGLLLFMVMTFCILGTSLFRGMISYKHATGSDTGAIECPAGLGGASRKCVLNPLPSMEEQGWIHRISDKEFFGYHGFDNFFQAFVTIFVQLTCDGGMQDVPQHLNAAGGATQFVVGSSWIYFVIVVIGCSWVTLSLFTAVVSSVFGVVAEHMAQSVVDATKTNSAVNSAVVGVSMDEDGTGVVPFSLGSPKPVFDLEETQGKSKKKRKDSYDEDFDEEEGPATPLARRRRRPDKGMPRTTKRGKEKGSCDFEDFDLSGMDNLQNMNDTSSFHFHLPTPTQIAEAPTFETFIMVCIIVNAISLGIVTPDSSQSLISFVNVIDVVALTVFTVEFLIKIAAYGAKGYFQSSTNRFDFTVLVISMCAVVIPKLLAVETQTGKSAFILRFIRILRIFRLAQLTRLLHMFSNVKGVLAAVFETWRLILSLSLFIIFMQCAFSIFAMHLFGGALPNTADDGECWGTIQWKGHFPDSNVKCGRPGISEYTRRNFETFPNAMLTCFQYLTGESWSQVMFFYMKYSGFPVFVPCIFFMLLFIWQNCITLSMFVALLLDKFVLHEHEKDSKQKRIHFLHCKKEEQLIAKQAKLQNSVALHWANEVVRDHKASKKLSATVAPSDATLGADPGTHDDATEIEGTHDGGDTGPQSHSPADQVGGSMLSHALSSHFDQSWSTDQALLRRIWGFLDEDNSGALERDEIAILLTKMGRQLSSSAVDAAMDEIDANRDGNISFAEFELWWFNQASEAKEMLRSAFAAQGLPGRKGMSFGLFGVTHPFRRACTNLTSDSRFEMFILVLIIVGCGQLAFEGPESADTEKTDAWSLSDYFNSFSLVCFVLEAFGKSVAHGFISRTELQHPAYLQEPLNWIDFIIVLLLCASHLPFLLMGGAATVGGWGRTLRALRVLQSLRMFGRNSRLRIILNALLNSIPGAGAVLMLLLIFTYIYAVIGMELFGGTFKRCCLCDKEIDIVYRTVNGTTIETMEQCLAQNDAMVIPDFDLSRHGDTHDTKSLRATSINASNVNRTVYMCESPPCYCWENPPYHFDSVGFSFQTLFEVLTTHGWVDIMEAAMDVTGPGLQPTRNASPGASAYFITFHVVVTFFLLNMFVGGKCKPFVLYFSSTLRRSE